MTAMSVSKPVLGMCVLYIIKYTAQIYILVHLSDGEC